MRLPEKDWTNPVKDPRDFSPYGAAYVRYSAKLYQMSQIWSRLRSAASAHEEYIEWLRARALGEVPEPSPNQEHPGVHFNRETQFIHLDLEDFLIHGRILMDRFALLVGYLLPGTVRSMEIPSFHDHREFFFKTKNIPYKPDEVYAAYIRKKTGWFQTLLKDYRDLFIVHDSGTQLGGMLSGPQMPPREMAGRAGRSGPSGEEARHKLSQLYAKYSPKFGPALPPLEPGDIYMVLDFFDVHADQLERDEVKALRQIKRRIGAYSPDVNLLADRILEYLRFCGEHFKDRGISR